MKLCLMSAGTKDFVIQVDDIVFLLLQGIPLYLS